MIILVHKLVTDQRTQILATALKEAIYDVSKESDGFEVDIKW